MHNLLVNRHKWVVTTVGASNNLTNSSNWVELPLVQGCFADFARSETGAAGGGAAGAGAAASGAAGTRTAGAVADGAAATETGAAGAGDAGAGDAGAGRLLCYFYIRNRFWETLINKCFKITEPNTNKKQRQDRMGDSQASDTNVSRKGKSNSQLRMEARDRT